MQYSFKRILLFLMVFALFPSVSLAFGPIVVGREPIYVEDDDPVIVTHEPISPVIKNKIKAKIKSTMKSKSKSKAVMPANKELIKNFYNEVWVNNNDEAIFIYLDKEVNGYINDKHYYITDFEKKMKLFQTNHKEVTLEFKDLIEQKDKVAVYVTICATRLSTNKKECVPNIGIYTIKAHKITEFTVNAIYPKDPKPVFRGA